MRGKRTWIIYEITHDGEFSSLWLGIGSPTRSVPCAAAHAAHPWSQPWKRLEELSGRNREGDRKMVLSRVLDF
jgi:hypothetical protein